jgi:hypothetical protein
MSGAARSVIATSPEPDNLGFSFGDLRVFTSIPLHHHDVVALSGFVVVYETDSLGREGVNEGSLYVVEDQRPVGGMSWELYDRLNREYGPRDPRVRVSTSRRVIRAVKRDSDASHWWHVHPSGFHDGPFPDWAAAHTMVGKVVSVYRPGPLAQDMVS